MVDVSDVESPSLDEEHLLDIDPILGSVEQEFEDDDILPREDGDLDFREGHESDTLRTRLMKAMSREEEIERIATPRQAHLSVAFELPLAFVGHVNAQRTDDIEDLRCSMLKNEDVQIDVDRGPRLAVVSERESAAERYSDPWIGESVGHANDPLIQSRLTHGKRTRAGTASARGRARSLGAA